MNELYFCSLVTWPPGSDPASRRCNLSLARPQISNALDNFPDDEVKCSEMLTSTPELHPSPAAREATGYDAASGLRRTRKL